VQLIHRPPCISVEAIAVPPGCALEQHLEGSAEHLCGTAIPSPSQQKHFNCTWLSRVDNGGCIWPHGTVWRHLWFICLSCFNSVLAAAVVL